MSTDRRVQNDNDKPDRPGVRSAEIILIPKQLRAEWTDVMAMDSGLSLLAFRVACVIGSHFNRHTGDTFISRETVADAIGYSLRSIVSAINELERRGYLIVRRRKLKETPDGRAYYGGRGTANVYLPAFERSQVAATNAGRRFADRIDEAWQRVHDRASVRRRKGAADCTLSESNECNGLHSNEAQSVQSGAGKGAAGCTPTHGKPTVCNPGRERAGARGSAPAHSLGAEAAALLRLQLGDATFDSWIAEVTVLEVLLTDGGELVLGAKSRFMADWVGTRYGAAIRDAFNATMPKGGRVERVTVKVRP